MSRFNDRLKNVSVAAPCSVDWDTMIGDERVRFCGQCQLNVYDLSAMTRAEAEAFVARTEGRLCVRFYRRKDGSILTDNCPVGLRALRRRAQRIRKAVASSVLGFLAGIGAYGVVESVASYFSPHFAAPYVHTMGTMIVPPKQPQAFMPPSAPRTAILRKPGRFRSF